MGRKLTLTTLFSVKGTEVNCNRVHSGKIGRKLIVTTPFSENGTEVLRSTNMLIAKQKLKECFAF